MTREQKCVFELKDARCHCFITGLVKNLRGLAFRVDGIVPYLHTRFFVSLHSGNSRRNAITIRSISSGEQKVVGLA
jgi:hypothetical protein